MEPVSIFHYPEDVYNQKSAMEIVPLLLLKYNPASVIDMGCGNGDWLHVFAEKGVNDILGVDAYRSPTLAFDPSRFVCQELDQLFHPGRKFDLCLCLEVAEHITENRTDILFTNITSCSDIIIFSAAVPGQGGEGHVNEQPPAYWKEKFNKFGFKTYDWIRPLIWDNQDVLWWYKQNIFVACKEALHPDLKTDIPFLIHPDHYEEKERTIANLEHRPQRSLWTIIHQIKNKFHKK